MGQAEIVAFLLHLVIQKNCAPATQNQVLNAIVSLFRCVLGRDLGDLKNIRWARRRRHTPVVMTREEVAAVLTKLSSNFQKWLVASLLYGCGMQLSEALQLRVKDVDFGQGNSFRSQAHIGNLMVGLFLTPDHRPRDASMA
jgi:integrase